MVPPSLPPANVFLMPDRTKSLCLAALALLAVAANSAAAADAALEGATFSEPPSFLQDVMPAFTRYGCNAGGCHGKLAGQKGFKLSLRGYAPESDFEALTRESRGRRLNMASPELSLLLKKGIGAMPHGGGTRFEAGGKADKLLQAWIAAGAPGPVKDEATVVRLEVTPRTHTLKAGERIPLKAIATYSDGKTRDVTWLTRFDANDPSQLEVAATGVVTSLRHGESAVRAAFLDHVEVAVISTPWEQPTQPQWYATRNNAIDDAVFSKLAALRIEPSPLCDDATFLRRAMLDTIGTLPTPEEVRAFQADTRADKRQQLVESLLARPEWIDFWALQLADLFQNRKERDHDVRGLKGVRAFHAWLREELAAGRPWNELAKRVLLAQGSSSEQPAVGYYVVTVGEKSPEQSEVADSVAQAFLGVRIGCARCHNHPLERYTQDDYYHFAGFFSRISMDRNEPEKGLATRLTIGTQHSRNLSRQIEQEEKKLGEAKGKNDAKEIERLEKQIASLKKQIDDHLKGMVGTGQPRTGKFLPARPLDRQETNIPAGGDPRQALADWITAPSNEQFSGAIINRIWRHYLGVGLIEPVDDLRATNPPSNRELWQTLNKEFVGGGFDLKKLMRSILLSRTYQLASETRPGNALDSRFYSHYYPRRLQAEVLLDSLVRVTGQPERFPGYPLGIRAIQVPDPTVDSYFLTVFGRSGRVTACACERSGDITLPQLLHLHGGVELARKISGGDGRLAKLLGEQADNDRLTDELFLSTFGRLPKDEERATVRNTLAGGAPRVEVFQDLLWALMNSQEFAFNH